MEVLLALAARPGQLVARQTLLDEVWGDVVVLDDSLTKAIQVLRSYFADKPANPEFIRTVPRRGYELIAPVAPVAPVASVASVAPVAPAGRAATPDGTGTSPDPELKPRRRAGWRLPVAVAGGALMLILAAVGAYLKLVPPREAVTLAVIPPIASGEASELGFVGEGLADYLIDQLSRNPRLDVVARRSSFAMRDTDANVRAIGEQLEARYLVEGSLRKDGDGLLLTLFLVDTETGTNTWTTQIRGAADGVSDLQRRSADLLRGAMRARLGIAIEPVATAREPIPELANRKYLQARYQWTLRGERRIDRSIRLLEEALTIEPDYTDALLALAQSVAVKPFYDRDEPVADQFKQARANAARALALNPALEADVAALEGFMLFHERHWTQAQASLQRALDLAPENVNALYWYSTFLSQIGRYDDALPFILKAQKLDPVSAVVNDRLGMAYVWVDDLEKAAERFRIAADLGYGESTQPLSMAMFLYRAGRFGQLRDLLLRLGGDPYWVLPTVSALEHPEERDAVSELIDGIAVPDAMLETVRFGIWFLFGQTDRAFRDFDAGPKTEFIEPLWSPEAANLRSDPRFEALLESIGFTGEDRALLPDTYEQ